MQRLEHKIDMKYLISTRKKKASKSSYFPKFVSCGIMIVFLMK